MCVTGPLGTPLRMNLDLAMDWFTDGYRAIPRLREKAGGAASFPVRLMGRRALVVAGPAAVRRFYDPATIIRHRAVPAALARLLFGRGAVHGLDGEEHARRKEQFLKLLDAEAAATIGGLVRERLGNRLRGEAGHVARVFDLLVEVYGEAVLTWAGIEDADPAHISRMLAAIVDGFGGAGKAYPRAWVARWRLNRWAEGLIREARTRPGADTPLDVVAGWRDARGELLPPAVAGVELLNLLRPAVAIAYLGSFAVLALDDHPEWQSRLAADGSAQMRRCFSQEVRRTCPFVPALAGRVRRSVEWDGHRLKAGERVVLDVPGTNHDPQTWERPDTFDPERFAGRDIDPYELVPQGGGRPEAGHRCPGEGVTLEVLDATLEAFSTTTWNPVRSGHDDIRIPARERLTLLVGGADPGPGGTTKRSAR